MSANKPPLATRTIGLEDPVPPGSVFTRPRGGIFVWARLPDGWSATAVLERADDVSLRLSVSNHTPETISEGMGRLAAAIATSPALAR
jgi:2-aminoadipate transaminase